MKVRMPPLRIAAVTVRCSATMFARPSLAICPFTSSYLPNTCITRCCFYRRDIVLRHLATAAGFQELQELQGIITFLLDEIGLKPQHVDKMIECHHVIFSVAVDSARAVVNFLHIEVGMQRPAARAAAIRANPQLLSRGVEALHATLTALRAAASEDAVNKIVSSCPAALLMTPIEIQLRKMQLSDIGVAFEKIANGHPSLLIRDWDAIRCTFDFLCSPQGAGMSQSQASRISEKYHMLLTYEPEKHLAPLVSFIRDDLCMEPSSELCECLYAWPRTDVFRTTANFLMKEMGYSLDDLRPEIDIIAYSLEQSIGPRGMFVLRKGLARPPLGNLGKVDDGCFCKEMGVDLKEFQEYLVEQRASNRRGRAQRYEAAQRYKQSAS